MTNIDIEKISMEDVEKLYSWLRGKPVDVGMFSITQPALTEEQAFSVIYYLQEVLGVLPDHYERCKECGRIFDSYNEGISIDEDSEYTHHDEKTGKDSVLNYDESLYGNYCEDCEPCMP